MIAAPWWARWLYLAAVATTALVVISAVMFPTLFYSFGWLGALLVLLGLGLAGAVPIALVQTQVLKSYGSALAGLNLEQRAEVLRALRNGQVPDDPRVLAAAVRAGTISLAHRRRAGRQKIARWAVLGGYTLIALSGFIGSNPRLGVLGIGSALCFAILYVRQHFISRGFPERIERLRAAAAAAAIPEAAETEDSVSLPPRRLRTALLLTLAFGIAFGAVVWIWGSPREKRDCRTADKVVDLIYTNPKLLDANLITPGEPALSRYQDWSKQLQDYAHQVTDADLARHLHRIAELSTQAVSLVDDVRKEPAGSLPPDVISDRENDYQKIISELIAEDRALNSICHPHS
jgi:hypothetical protein